MHLLLLGLMAIDVDQRKFIFFVVAAPSDSHCCELRFLLVLSILARLLNLVLHASGLLSFLQLDTLLQGLSIDGILHYTLVF